MIPFFATMKPCLHTVVGPDDLHERSQSNSRLPRLPLLSLAYPNQIPPSLPHALGPGGLSSFLGEERGGTKSCDFTLVW